MAPRPNAEERRIIATARGLSQAFWALAGGIVVAYVFFLALGAFSSREVGAVTVVVAVLALLWAVHAVRSAQRRANAPEGARDPAGIRARERRGF